MSVFNGVTNFSKSGSTLSVQNYGNNKETASGDRYPWTVYLQCCFVSVATILGTGILGLPDTLSQSGFTPFVLTFTFCFLVQILLVFLFTDIIQRCQARLDQEQNSNAIEVIPLVEAADEFFDDLSDYNEPPNESLRAPQLDLQQEKSRRQSPSLTLLARFFLPKCLRYLFNTTVLFGFVSVMISYCLAAGKEYSSLLHIDQTIVIAVFGMSFGLFVVFGYWIVKPVISTLTFVKGSVLVAVVVVTMFVSTNVQIEVINDFSKVMQPLLMSTVALGGAVNVMPMLFGLLPNPNSKRQVRGFRTSVCLGILICYVLNLTWCWAVLNIVPQRCADLVKANISCSISLEIAEMNGEPSTIPLKKMILQQNSDFRWITVFIQIFIIVSISVSFLTHVAAFSHTIEGSIIYMFRSTKSKSTCLERLKNIRLIRQCSSERGIVRLTTISTLVLIVGFSMLRPDSFVMVLERLGSLTLNLECGPLLFVMVAVSNSSVNKMIKIPLPMSKWIYASAIIILSFGVFSLVFDIYGFVTTFIIFGDKSKNSTEPT